METTQLETQCLAKEAGYPPSPTKEMSRSSSSGSSNWSFASVPYRSPDSLYELEFRKEADSEEEKEQDSPTCGDIILETAETTDDNNSKSSKSAPASPESQSEDKSVDWTADTAIERSHPSSPRVYRMVSERSQLSRLGFQYRYGCGPFSQNLMKSSKFYAEAAELGCGDSLAALAVAYIFEIGVPRSLNAARLMLRKAIMKGSLDGLEIRALCSMDGIFDGKRSYPSCLQLLTFGIARNSPACLLWAGFCFETGLGINPDPYAAKQAYLAAGKSSTMMYVLQQTLPGAMECEDPWTLLKAALYFLHSSGDPEHRDHAMVCLKQAALLGFRDAQVYLAICLIQGTWLQKDTSAATYWLKQEEEGKEPHPVAQRILRQLD